MNAPKSLLVATTNPGKVREIAPFFKELDLELAGLEALDARGSFEETGETFEENAQQKALYYHRLSGLPTIADDSGLVIDALGKEPGVRSNRYLGADVPHSRKIEHILKRLKGVPAAERTAHFTCALALAVEGDIFSIIVKRVFGLIAEESRGDGGFGYDPIFYCPLLGCTLAEADAEEKNRVSHRGLAMRALVHLIKTHEALREKLGLS